jgi:hypothetical protein
VAPSSAGGAAAGPTFELLLRRTAGVTVAPFSMLQIPFQFAPSSIREHRGAITVRMDAAAVAEAGQGQGQGQSALVWTYPLHGETEGSVSEAPLALTCLARECVEEVRELRLGGLPQFQSMAQQQQQQSVSAREAEQFGVHVECESEAAQAALGQWLQLSLLPTATPSLQRVGLSLRPMVPLRAEGVVVVSRRGGGRWKFPLSVSVDPPAPDDTIRVEAAVHTTTSVAFRLQNFKSGPTPFRASLSADTPAQFSVTPRSGVLPPPGELDAAGQPGALFVVTFAPSEYGQALHGALHITAERMAYTYALLGSNLRYEAPTAASQLDNHNDAYVRSISSPTKRAVNHVAANVRALKDGPLLSHKVAKVRAWKGVGSTSSAAIAASAVTAFPALNNGSSSK